jgi:hypothetical protein
VHAVPALLRAAPEDSGRSTLIHNGTGINLRTCLSVEGRVLTGTLLSVS